MRDACEILYEEFVYFQSVVQINIITVFVKFLFVQINIITVFMKFLNFLNGDNLQSTIEWKSCSISWNTFDKHFQTVPNTIILDGPQIYIVRYDILKIWNKNYWIYRSKFTKFKYPPKKI